MSSYVVHRAVGPWNSFKLSPPPVQKKKERRWDRLIDVKGATGLLYRLAMATAIPLSQEITIYSPRAGGEQRNALLVAIIHNVYIKLETDITGFVFHLHS